MAANSADFQLALPQYFTSADLEAMEVAQLKELLGQVPTERIREYKDIYERNRKNAGISSDEDELKLINHYLSKYANGVIPDGHRWFRAPERIVRAVTSGESYVPPEEIAGADAAPKPNLLAIAAVIGIVLFMGFIFISRSGGDESAENTSTSNEAASIIYTPTPRKSPTPTPIALEEQDDIIEDGDEVGSGTFPVGLQIYLFDSRQPRVFVVQTKRIEMAEWDYDPNPDVANYIGGLEVQRVIGIPWSRQNQQLFDELTEGARFHLRMNTGAILEFEFDSKLEVKRSDTAAFRQISPGLVLVLVGERDSDNQPTETRTLIVARYLPEQEVAREGYLAAGYDLATPVASPTPLIPSATPPPAKDLLHAEIVQVTTVSNQLNVRVRIYNGQYEQVALTSEDIRLALGYTPHPPGPWVVAANLEPQSILPGQALDLTLIWQWEQEPYATISIASYVFDIQLAD